MNEKTWTWHRLPPWSFAAALAFAMALLATDGEAETPFKLDMPLSCVAGETCWIVNYVDHDPTDGIRDYSCGETTYNLRSKRWGNRHLGTDIAIRDLGAMRLGVEVLAAAVGTAVGVRVGMEDLSVREIGVEALKGKLCGNRVGILHPGGWLTQYCHLRKGSVAVKNGDRVKAGQPIGLVGLSGFTEYPHLHFQVMKQVAKDQKIVDPFVGLERTGKCGLGDNPLWKSEVLASLPYRPTAIYNAGFASKVPNAKAAHDGRYKDKELSRLSPALVLWVDIFRVQTGDNLIFRITGPNGEKILRFGDIIKKNQARRFVYAGKPRKSASWPPGVYRGEIHLLREKGPKGREEYSISRQVSLR